MKMRILLSVLILLLILFTMGCEKLSTPLESPSGQDQAARLNKKPIQEKPTIHSFKIQEIENENVNWEEVLIEEEELIEFEGIDLSHVIDFTNEKKYKMTYETTHPDGIQEVVMFIYYDTNCDGQIQQEALEYKANVFVHENVTEEQTFDWEGGKIMKRFYPLDPFTSDTTLIDQLATYNNNPEEYPSADRYGIYIWVKSGGDRMQVAELSFYMWIKAKPATEGLLSVEEVVVSAYKTKGANAKPIAEVRVVNSNVDNDPLSGITVCGNWTGINISNCCTFKGGPPDDDGWVTIEGPEFKNKGSDEIIFTVSTLRKVGAVYNPKANIGWDWPDEKPSGSKHIPIKF